jgi:hypothetical protein
MARSRLIAADAAHEGAMRVILSIAGSVRRKNRSGCPKSDFLEGGAPLVSPFFRPDASSTESCMAQRVEKFRVVEASIGGLMVRTGTK